MWNEVQRKHKEGEHFHTPSAKREVSVFAGLVKCADCGSTMMASLRGSKGKEKLTYRCCLYTKCGKDACPSHNIREEILERVVLNDFHAYAKLADADMQDLIDHVISALRTEEQTGCDQVSRQLVLAEQKLEGINNTLKNLYQDKISGKMPESFFYNLLSDYEKERQAL